VSAVKPLGFGEKAAHFLGGTKKLEDLKIPFPGSLWGPKKKESCRRRKKKKKKRKKRKKKKKCR
jgi:hypothetical protein